MPRSIFITRSLNEDSPLHALGSDYLVAGESLLTLTPRALDDRYSDCDWLFFYSKNGVAFFDELGGNLLQYKIGCIGRATAQSIQLLVGRPADVIGSSDGATTADLLRQQLCQTDKVAFMRAKNSRQAVQKHLNQKQVVDIILYDNVIKTQVDIPDSDIVILTSPLNAEAYLARMTTSGKLIIAIGQTTGHYLTMHGVTQYHTPSSPSEKCLAILLQELS